MTTTYPYTGSLVVIECCNCHTDFGMADDLYRQCRNDSGKWFYCPQGHSQHFTGKSDAQKLADSQARETALRDQLHAAEADAEASRTALIRDRSRFANGVCPCCNRTFQNVLRHMQGEHPEYDAKDLKRPAYRCSCTARFETFHGLRVHQGKVRPDNWQDPKVGKFWRHLTVTS